MRALATYVRYHHVGLLALFVALSGTAYAATLPRNSVGPNQLRSNAVTSAKIKNHSLRATDFARSALSGAGVYAHIRADGTLDGARSQRVTLLAPAFYGTNPATQYPLYCFSLAAPADNVVATIEESVTMSGGDVGFRFTALNASLDASVFGAPSGWGCAAGTDAAVVVGAHQVLPFYVAFQ